MVFSTIFYATSVAFIKCTRSFLPLLTDTCRTNFPSSTVQERQYGVGVMVDTRPA